jgi:hypothetical protein
MPFPLRVSAQRYVLSAPQSLFCVHDAQIEHFGTQVPESQMYPSFVQSESELHGGTRQFPVDILHS